MTKRESKTFQVNLTENDAVMVSRPDVYLHFAHHDFDIVWNEETKRQDVVRGIHVYYGGMGEGSTFETWQEAIHVSLYDMYQVYEGFQSGDMFVVTYGADTRYFVCDGCHVIPCDDLALCGCINGSQCVAHKAHQIQQAAIKIVRDNPDAGISVITKQLQSQFPALSYEDAGRAIYRADETVNGEAGL